MSYSSNPERDAARHYDALSLTAEQRYLAEDLLRDEFIREIFKLGPMALTALKQRKDWKTGEMIRPPIFELMNESLDHLSGPQMHEVFALLIAAAEGENIKDRANQLIAAMAQTWAYYEVDA